MRQPKFRVLLDLSMALGGFGGIPQDVRLLYKTLSLCPDVEVTGLVYPWLTQPRRHRFCSTDQARGERLANQACFLWGLTDLTVTPSRFRAARMIEKLNRILVNRWAAPPQVDPLDVEMFWQVIWRLFFSQTLAAEDAALVRDGKFLLTNLAPEMIHSRAVNNRRPVKLDTRGYDFLIVQSARPLRPSPGTRQIVRYHDMITTLHPDTVGYLANVHWNHKATLQSLDSFYACNSEPTRQDLLEAYPQLESNSETIPYVLSDVYRPDPDRSAIRSIVDVRRSDASGVQPHRPLKSKFPYLMSVSTLEPRKNFIALIEAFTALKLRPPIRDRLRGLKLMIVGSPGWKYEPILGAMRELIHRGDLIHLEHVSSEELRVLYTHAEALVFPSLAEGFGFPPMEAMLCDAPVIASDIPAHRWVLGDAALYCNPYDVTSITATVQRLVASEESPSLRADMIARGRKRVKLFSIDRCSDQWIDLFHRLKGQSAHSSRRWAGLPPRARRPAA